MSADGQIGDHIHLTNQAAKGKSGRVIPINKELKKQLVKVMEIDGIDRADSGQFVIRTRRQQGTTAQVVVNIRLSASPECALRYLESVADLTVRELLSQVSRRCSSCMFATRPWFRATWAGNFVLIKARRIHQRKDL